MYGLKPVPFERVILAQTLTPFRDSELFPMDQAALDRANSSLCAVTNTHLIQHAAHMDAHRLLGNAQLLGYIAVVLPAGNTSEYFVLAGSQLHQGSPFR